MVADLRRYDAVSVFMVGGAITEMRIAAAIAATRQFVKPMGYVLLDIGGYLAVCCEGTTPDDGVNAVHSDIPNLDDAAIVEFADMIVDGDVTELTEDDVINAVKDSVRSGYMEKSRIKFKIEWD